MADRSEGKLSSWGTLAVTVVGWVFLGGMGFQTLKDHERRMDKFEAIQSTDHDAITAIVPKVNDIHQWMQDSRKRP